MSTIAMSAALKLGIMSKPMGHWMTRSPAARQIRIPFSLAQNFPNPFNPATTIRFGLKEQSPVTLRIYDPAGRQVRELVSGTLPAGHYDEQWDGLRDNGSTAASGWYDYRLTSRIFIETKNRFMLIFFVIMTTRIN